MVNKEGYKPLTLWMLELNSKPNKSAARRIIEAIAAKTDMSEWKNSKQLEERNELNIRNRMSRAVTVVKRKRRAHTTGSKKRQRMELVITLDYLK